MPAVLAAAAVLLFQKPRLRWNRPRPSTDLSIRIHYAGIVRAVALVVVLVEPEPAHQIDQCQSRVSGAFSAFFVGEGPALRRLSDLRCFLQDVLHLNKQLVRLRLLAIHSRLRFAQTKNGSDGIFRLGRRVGFPGAASSSLVFRVWCRRQRQRWIRWHAGVALRVSARFRNQGRTPGFGFLDLFLAFGHRILQLARSRRRHRGAGPHGPLDRLDDSRKAVLVSVVVTSLPAVCRQIRLDVFVSVVEAPQDSSGVFLFVVLPPQFRGRKLGETHADTEPQQVAARVVRYRFPVCVFERIERGCGGVSPCIGSIGVRSGRVEDQDDAVLRLGFAGFVFVFCATLSPRTILDVSEADAGAEIFVANDDTGRIVLARSVVVVTGFCSEERNDSIAQEFGTGVVVGGTQPYNGGRCHCGGGGEGERELAV
mmetsp:Transcript_17772/g.36553  ORF Transcript_17772/g.36553 Transcript_17772/m.36553 type:complete len:425 (-) Transcript_17772:69-1343(-)